MISIDIVINSHNINNKPAITVALLVSVLLKKKSVLCTTFAKVALVHNRHSVHGWVGYIRYAKLFWVRVSRLALLMQITAIDTSYNE